MVTKKLFVFLIIAVGCFRLLRFAESKVPQEEVDALQEITATMGSTYWKFNGDSCEVEMVGVTQEPPKNSEHEISCERETNSNVCHIVRIVLKRHNLPGMLPPQLVKLPHLREMSLEANQFSGAIPPELGNLINLKTLMLSSNQLTGNLPLTFALLRNLTDFRINDNNFNGTIPSFIQKWEQLSRLEMHASGLEGPIPTSISLLSNLVELRISDINGPNQGFPMVRNMTGIVRLVLRNCNIFGEIPAYVWAMKNLEMFGNMLSGDVPDSILKQGTSIDLSYNNFTWQGPEKPVCHENMNLNLNLFRSSSSRNNLRGALPCRKDFTCPQCNKHNFGSLQTDTKGDMPSGTFTLKQIKVATDDFNSANKIGEGGFGPVYKACHLQQTGSLIGLLDERLRSEVKKEEAELVVKVALLCTNASASLRPTMSEAVSMLEGRMTVPDLIPEPGNYTEDLRFKAMRDLRRQKEDQSSSGSQTQNSTTVHTIYSSSTSHSSNEINPVSRFGA
ncbi:hypothetical protein SCA6_019994 [Theobroma cacao]